MVSHRDLVTYLSNESWSAATRRSKSTTVRSFYGWADLECRNPRVNPAAKLGAVKVPRGRPRPTPAAVLQSALQRADARGRLMLMLGAHAGLRRSEIAKVHSRDAVEGMLRVTGKGGHTRVIPLSPDLAAAIASRGDGYLFPGKIDGHLSADAVANVVVDLLGGGWTAHTLRHAFATKAYAADRDLLAVQELLGHSSPQTTAVYAAVPSDAMHRAVLAAAG
jgi:integrase